MGWVVFLDGSFLGQRHGHGRGPDLAPRWDGRRIPCCAHDVTCKYEY